MKLKLTHLEGSLTKALFMVMGAKGKKFHSLGIGDELDVPDDDGHELMARYKGNFKVVHYGDQVPHTEVQETPNAALAGKREALEAKLKQGYRNKQVAEETTK